MGEEARDRQGHGELRLDAADHPDGHEGVTAELEEVVVASDALDAQQL